MRWLVVLRNYVALAVFQPYRDFEAGDNQSLKFKWQGGELRNEKSQLVHNIALIGYFNKVYEVK